MAGKYRGVYYALCKYGLRILPDALFHNVNAWIMFKRFGAEYHWMNIHNPRTFSEKLQYLKTHPVCQNQTELADKYDVREFVRKTIGEEYLIPLINVFSSVEEIDFNQLPNQFVLKLTKGSGYNLICNDKTQINWADTKRKLKSWLKVNPYLFSREPQYKGKSRYVCEEMLEYNITDYKFFCFNGKPEYIELYADRLGNHKKAFYDMSWNRMPFTTANDICEEEIPKPKEFDEMKTVAERLSAGLRFVRVDLYVHNERVYFGEMTFYPAGGYTPITPREWDLKLGEKIELSSSSKNNILQK